MPATRRTIRVITCAIVAWAIAGCGVAGGGSPMVPISISLSTVKVVVTSNGTPTRVQIAIMSTSETALVMFRGLPAGVQASYAASDTSPSGLLTFSAATLAQAGTYMPSITVNSAGQTATLDFTLVVATANKGA